MRRELIALKPIPPCWVNFIDVVPAPYGGVQRADRGDHVEGSTLGDVYAFDGYVFDDFSVEACGY